MTLPHIAFDAQLALLENSLSRYIRNLVQQLGETSPEMKLSLLVFSNRSADQIRAEHDWIPPQARLVVMPGTETPYHLSRWEAFRRYHLALPRKIRELGADIFQAHYGKFPIPSGFRVVTVVHDVFQWRAELGRSTQLWAPLRKLIDRWNYRLATLVCVSDWTKRDFQECLDPQHHDIQRIYSGNDPSFSKVQLPEDKADLEHYGLQSGRYFLYVGDLTPRKDVSTLIRAFHAALPNLPADVRLALTKGHWKVVPERDLVHQLGIQDRVTFLGDVANSKLPGLYRHCLAFVFPSLYEGFGFPPLEAMASGVPVLTTRNSAITEVTADAVLHFPDKDWATLASMLQQVAAEPELRQTLIERGLVQASKFHWQATARAYLELYLRVARTKT